MITTAEDALKQLKEGNQRFVSGVQSIQTLMSQANREEFAKGQRPFAVIIGCADSRVSPEIVFDQGIGDLFVIRVAGNVIEPTLVGSVEFAIHQLKTRLVVVLGHSNCGAVGATISEIKQPSENLSPNLGAIVEKIRPAIQEFVNNKELSAEALIQQAVPANVKASIEQLKQASPSLFYVGGLQIVGAEYSLTTGVVTFFD